MSVKPREIVPAVERLAQELVAVKARSAELESGYFAALAGEYAGQGDVLLLQPPMPPDSVRRLADAVSKTCGGLAAVFAGGEGQYHYALVHPGEDITPLVKSMNQALHGRGGGRNGFAQGSAQTHLEEINAFFGK